MTSPYADDSHMDVALNDVKNTAVRQVAGAMGVTANTYANIVTNTLGILTIAAANYGVPADGPVSGRKVVKNLADIPITVNGTADITALHDNVSKLSIVSELAATVAVLIGDTLQVAAFDLWRILDPTSAA